MKKALFAVLALSLVVGASALAADDTWTGEVLDVECYTKGDMGEDHAACAATCLKKGNDMALLVGDEVVKIDRDGSDADAIKTLEGLGGKAAKVTGEAMEGDDGTVTVTVSAAEAG